jgi:hypothetical protein
MDVKKKKKKKATYRVIKYQILLFNVSMNVIRDLSKKKSLEVVVQTCERRVAAYIPHGEFEAWYVIHPAVDCFATRRHLRRLLY